MYEGEISSYGDNIIIRTVPAVTVSDYSIGSNFSASDYQTPTSDAVELAINKAKKWLLRINTVDAAQSDIAMADTFADDASYRIKIAVDTDILGNVYTDAAAANQGVTAGAVSGNIDLGVDGNEVNAGADGQALNTLLDLGQAMDEQNIPDTGRWVVLPSWYIRLIKSSDLRDASIAGDGQSILRNGKVGMIDRLWLYQSNLLTVSGSGDTEILAGHSAGLAFASQITEVEKGQNPFDFGYYMRGLCVYGYKVIEPNYLFRIVANSAAA